MALLSNMLPPGGVVTPDGVQTLTNKTLTTPTINTPTINNGQANNLALANPTVNTSLNFSGLGLRLTGDFSNATVANRLSYQTSVTNGSTVVPLYPNGSGSVVGFAAPSTPYVVEVNGSERLRIAANGNVGIGTANPENKQTIAGASAYLSLLNTDTGVSSLTPAWNGIKFFADNESASGSVASIEGGNYLTNNYGGFLRFSTATHAVLGAPVERMRIDNAGNVLVTGSGGLGYGVGSGGSVTQATSKSTAVTLNKPTGQITMNNAALAAGASVVFVLNTSAITLTSDLVVVNTPGSVSYRVEALNPFVGTVAIRVTNVTGGSLSEALVINFAVIKGALS